MGSYDTTVSKKFMQGQPFGADICRFMESRARALLPDRAIDPHYLFSLNPDSTSSNVIVHDSSIYPIVAGPWMPDGPASKWVGPLPDTALAGGGTYIYRLTFDMTGLDTNTARITGKWTSDNNGVDILFNGHPTGQSQG